MLDWILEVTGADAVLGQERVQSLWSGYGEIVRLRLSGADAPSVIVKRVDPGVGRSSGRARAGDASQERSHDRKLRSYAVEHAWYHDWSTRCDASARVPRCLAAERSASGWRFALEDLDAAGFSGRRSAVVQPELDHCLAWLASFHATFLGRAPTGLWETGTYWHLGTRPDELAGLDDAALRDAAVEIDARLSACAHPTFVHGDAKLANFCFAPDARVAVVDFQYVGGGCGMKDVAYFLFGSHGWGEREPESGPLLDAYFEHLRRALEPRHVAVDADALEAEWRALYPFARADFHRFLAGWSPSRASLRAYRRALDELA